MIEPSLELPDLEIILQNGKPSSGQGTIDATLAGNGKGRDASVRSGTLKFATINVGTLDQDHALPGHEVTYKTHELLHQFLEGDYHIIAVQESRARVSRMVQHGPFTCLVSAAARGVGGVELWINGAALDDLTGGRFEPSQDACVWHATERIIAATCHFGQLTLDLINVYAPQRGRGPKDICDWWKELRDVVEQVTDRDKCFIMGDLNCSIGSITSDAIGTAGAELEDVGGECLRTLCNDFGMLVPSTSYIFHHGEHWTHCNAQGSRHRLDYFLIPGDCGPAVKKSFIDDGIDVLNGDRDHRVLALEVGVTAQTNKNNVVLKKPLYDRDAARKAKPSSGSNMFKDLPSCPWELDVNCHWSLIRDHLQTNLARVFPLKKRQERQLYFSQTTWNLVCYRKDLRQEHRQIQREKNLSILRQAFEVWRTGDADPCNDNFMRLAAHTSNLQEALVFHMRRKVDADFRKAKKHEWKQWVNHQLEYKISCMKNAKASEVYRILKPKKMVDRKKGRHHRPLPGLRDQEGCWRSSRADIALAWESQFAQIELAEAVDFSDLLQRSFAQCTAIHSDALCNIPSLYEFEQCLRCLKDSKAPGLDGIGAEVWQMDTAVVAMRVYPLLLKCAMRSQSVPELTGGWLLPLYKGKGSPSLMGGYRAILLEPTIARAMSRVWRSRLVQGLEKVAVPTQHGGRKGIGIEPLHLMVRMWQSNAVAAKKALGIAFLDVKSAFYRVVKAMLATFNGSAESLAAVFRDLKLPSTAYQQFLQNVGQSNMIEKASGSKIIAGHVASSLSHTWFLVPNGQHVCAPKTGSRPGDPCADILFGFVMSQILATVQERATLAGIALQVDVAEGLVTTNYVTWVDDIAFAVTEESRNVVKATITLFSIILDVMTEHGLTLSYGKGKTAAMFSFHGPHSVLERQRCEADYAKVCQCFPNIWESSTYLLWVTTNILEALLWPMDLNFMRSRQGERLWCRMWLPSKAY